MSNRREIHEGTILFLEKKNLYMGKIQVGFKDDGKPNRKSFYGKTKQEVIDKMRKVAFEYGIGGCYNPSNMILKEWMIFWLENFKKLTLKPKTYEVYEININTHIIKGLGNYPLKNLNTLHIQKFINDKYNSGLSTATVQKIYNILNGALKQANENDMIPKNPAKSVKLPTVVQKEIKVFTKEEQSKFEKEAFNSKLYPLFILGMDTGLRIGEILALTWSDIDFKNGIVKVNKDIVSVKDYEDEGDSNYILKVQDSPKTRSSIRKVPLSQRSLKLLKTLKEKANNTIIFHTRTNKYIEPKNVRRAFQNIVDKAKLENCGLHTLRHTFATRLFELGIQPKVVSKLLGHARVGITMDIYVSCNPSITNDAIKTLDNYHLEAINK